VSYPPCKSRHRGRRIYDTVRLIHSLVFRLMSPFAELTAAHVPLSHEPELHRAGTLGRRVSPVL